MLPGRHAGVNALRSPPCRLTRPASWARRYLGPANRDRQQPAERASAEVIHLLPERIECRNAERLEIPDVPGHHAEPVDGGCRRNSDTTFVSSTYTVYSKEGDRGRESRRRGGARDSARGSDASSSSFRFGWAIRCRLRHCSSGTTTAVSMPLRVTIWGPSAMVLSRSSLNRALALCTGHRLLIVAAVSVADWLGAWSDMNSRASIPSETGPSVECGRCSERRSPFGRRGREPDVFPTHLDETPGRFVHVAAAKWRIRVEDLRSSNERRCVARVGRRNQSARVHVSSRRAVSSSSRAAAIRSEWSECTSGSPSSKTRCR